MQARTRAFSLSWLTYASYYLGRKGFSVVKATLARELGLSTGALAWIDTAYLVAYAAGQLPSGIATDRWGSRRVLALGLVVSALACACFGAASSAAVFAGCFALNGLAQATGWPGTTKVVAEWTAKHERGRIMGLWSTCYQVGGIAATALASWLLMQHGWRAVFHGPALCLLAIAALVWFGLPRSTAPTVTSAASAGEATLQTSAAAESHEQLRALLRTPIVYGYGACYFCIKLIRYSLLFWLPFYLHTSAGFAEAESGYLSTGFEIGGVAGSILLGRLSDRWPHARAAVAAVSLLGLAGALWLYASVPLSSALWHFTSLALVGALLFGPDALVSGAAAQDAGGPRAAASATGLVNGLGSAGALLQGALTVGVQQAFGWQALFFVFVGLSLLSAACLVPGLRARTRAGL